MAPRASRTPERRFANRSRQDAAQILAHTLQMPWAGLATKLQVMQLSNCLGELSPRLGSHYVPRSNRVRGDHTPLVSNQLRIIHREMHHDRVAASHDAQYLRKSLRTARRRLIAASHRHALRMTAHQHPSPNPTKRIGARDKPSRPATADHHLEPDSPRGPHYDRYVKDHPQRTFLRLRRWIPFTLVGGLRTWRNFGDRAIWNRSRGRCGSSRPSTVSHGKLSRTARTAAFITSSSWGKLVGRRSIKARLPRRRR